MMMAVVVLTVCGAEDLMENSDRICNGTHKHRGNNIVAI